MSGVGLGPMDKLIGKLMLISKFMTSQTAQQIITIHILPMFQKVKATRE